MLGADGNGKGQLLNLQHSVTGVTALSTAVSRGRMDEIQLYLSKGADPSIPAKNGKTAIDFAGLFEYQEVRYGSAQIIFGVHGDFSYVRHIICSEEAHFPLEPQCSQTTLSNQYM